MTFSQREYAKERLTQGFDACPIPEHMWDGVRNYVLDGIPTGSFLFALFSNAPFLEVCSRADTINLAHLDNWAKFLYNYVPASCKGSEETVSNWKGIHD